MHYVCCATALDVDGISVDGNRYKLPGHEDNTVRCETKPDTDSRCSALIAAAPRRCSTPSSVALVMEEGGDQVSLCSSDYERHLLGKPIWIVF